MVIFTGQKIVTWFVGTCSRRIGGFCADISQFPTHRVVNTYSCLYAFVYTASFITVIFQDNIFHFFSVIYRYLNLNFAFFFSRLYLYSVDWFCECLRIDLFSFQYYLTNLPVLLSNIFIISQWILMKNNVNVKLLSLFLSVSCSVRPMELT